MSLAFTRPRYPGSLTASRACLRTRHHCQVTRAVGTRRDEPARRLGAIRPSRRHARNRDHPCSGGRHATRNRDHPCLDKVPLWGRFAPAGASGIHRPEQPGTGRPGFHSPTNKHRQVPGFHSPPNDSGPAHRGGPTHLRGKALSGKNGEAPGRKVGGSCYDEIADDEGTKPLSPSVKVMWVKGIIRPGPRCRRTPGDQGGQGHR